MHAHDLAVALDPTLREGRFADFLTDQSELAIRSAGQVDPAVAIGSVGAPTSGAALDVDRDLPVGSGVAVAVHDLKDRAASGE